MARTVGADCRARSVSVHSLCPVPPSLNPSTLHRGSDPTGVGATPTRQISLWFSDALWAERAARQIAAAANQATVALWVDEYVALRGGMGTTGDITRLGLLQRQRGWGREEFWRYWVEHHVPLVLSKRPRFDRYVTHLVRDPGVPFDGVVEQRFPDRGAWTDHDAQNSADSDIGPDASKFIGAITQFEATLILTRSDLP